MARSRLELPHVRQAVTFDPALQHSLERIVRARQRTWRSPAVMAGIVRDGELAWSLGVGAPDVDSSEVMPDVDTAFGIGSITKTFTAVMVMALRDESRLSLDDRLEAHVPGSKHGGLRIRELMSHASGLQREPVGDMWDTMAIPSIDALVADLDSADQVLPARLRWHYSNLAYSLLGEVVARLDRRRWDQSLHARILGPLGLSRTGLTPAAPHALGYYTDPFADVVHREPWPDMGGFAAAGGLWSTVRDLGQWVSFLATGNDEVLIASTLDEMSRPEIMADLDRWTLAWGLGLQLFRSGDRVLVGHGGAMPGFLAGIAVRRADRTGAVVLTNTSSGVAAPELAVELVGLVLDDSPTPVETWRPGPGVPSELADLVGRWWSEGSPFVFTVQAGTLQARLESAAVAPAVFEPMSADLYRTVSGREQGELLKVERAVDGTVSRLFWASYPFTRSPQVFG
jgi:CubicO group peptidase (beta-lactamase class C family)